MAEIAIAMATTHSSTSAARFAIPFRDMSGTLVNREPSVLGRSGYLGGWGGLSGTPSSCKIRWAITSSGSMLATASASLMPSSIRSASISA